VASSKVFDFACSSDNLGGGVNVVGTSERYGSAVQQVERNTMVDAK
jgi:hypothetical protein